mmetsp:Transcript_60638/g.67826  ORF Transcript_60638/g.67826 Transcript_60638/m.67826 type:complete len:247 (+) Transcript_60638:871-1611(+)
MMASKQLEVRHPITKELVSYITYASKMAVTDYTRFDSMIAEDVADKDVPYNSNLSHAHKVEFVANLSKKDRIIGGKHLALADGGANGNIIATDMRIIYFNSNGKCVSIGIAEDHQLTGNRLCCGCSVAKSSHGWIKLYWHQGAQMKTQQNSILSVVQMRDNGCLVNDIAKAHGRKQIIQTPNGMKQPFVIKNGLPYLEHYYPTDEQMKNITRLGWMTSKATWDPSKLDDIAGASDCSISQFLTYSY